MLCFRRSASSNARSDRAAQNGTPHSPANPGPTTPGSAPYSSGHLAGSSTAPEGATGSGAGDVLSDMLEPGRRVAHELKKLFQGAGMTPVPAARDSMLINLSMVHLMDEGVPERQWASPSGRLFPPSIAEDAAGDAAEATGTVVNGALPQGVAPQQRAAVRAMAAGAGMPAQRGFMRVSSMAHNRSGIVPGGPSGVQAGSLVSVPGSTDASLLGPSVTGSSHNVVDDAALQQPSIVEEVEEEPGTRALNWTASRKALAVLVVREEHLSKTDKKLALLSHEKRLADRLARLNLEVVVMAGDGNCQFRSLAHELLGNQDFHQHIRDKVMIHIRRHKEEYECFLGEDFEAYVDSMSRSRTWGDELTLRAACDAFRVTINVLTSDATNWYMIYEPQTPRDVGAEIWVTYIAPLHYNTIRRSTTLRKLSKSLSSSFRRLANSGQLKGPKSLEASRSP